MRLESKANFHWQEPRAFVQRNDAIERADRRWWARPLQFAFASTSFGSWMYLFRQILHQAPHSFPASIVSGLLFGIWQTYFIPWLFSDSPSEILLYDESIARKRGFVSRPINYSQIVSFSWRVSVGFSTLVLQYGKRSREVIFGVPPEISKDAVAKFLVDHNVPREPDPS